MKGCLMLFCGCVFVLTGLGMLKGEEPPAKGSTKSATVYPIEIVPPDNLPPQCPKDSPR